MFLVGCGKCWTRYRPPLPMAAPQRCSAQRTIILPLRMRNEDLSSAARPLSLGSCAVLRRLPRLAFARRECESEQLFSDEYASVTRRSTYDRCGGEIGEIGWCNGLRVLCEL